MAAVNSGFDALKKGSAPGMLVLVGGLVMIGPPGTLVLDAARVMIGPLVPRSMMMESGEEGRGEEEEEQLLAARPKMATPSFWRPT